MRTIAITKTKTSKQFVHLMKAKLEFTVRKLASKVGVSPAMVSAWSQGYEIISVQHWKLIFSYLESRGDNEGEELLKLAKRVAIKEYESKLGIA